MSRNPYLAQNLKMSTSSGGSDDRPFLAKLRLYIYLLPIHPKETRKVHALNRPVTNGNNTRHRVSKDLYRT
jgi:hypothetical protein